jgi:hypothetical protein
MKKRQGFVSNSSASSFIVPHIHYFTKYAKKGKLNKKEIDKLLKYGFKETGLIHPSHMDIYHEGDDGWKVQVADDGRVISQSFAHWVSCNEDEVIKFLVINDIGFIANGHYGHVTYLFHKGDKNVMVFRNYGAEVETYHYDKKWEEITRFWKVASGEPYTQIPIDIIKKEW